MGEVHADDVQPILAEGVDGSHGVRLRTDGANDRSTAVVLGGFEFGIEGRKPCDLG